MDEGLADLLHRVVMLLGDATRQLNSNSDGPTYSQLRLLGTLDDIGSVTQHQLAQALSVSDPAVSRAIQPLEASGLVSVIVDPDHARRRLVTITKAGVEAFHAVGKPLADTFREVLLAADFPYDRYFDDTTRLAGILEHALANYRASQNS